MRQLCLALVASLLASPATSDAQRADVMAVVARCVDSCDRSDAELLARGPARLPAIVGIWRVTKFCSNDSTGHLSERYGPHPTGYFVYAPNGQLSIQAMRSPPVRPFAGGDDHPTDTERRALLEAYFGYYGTYTVTSDSTVVHHVEGGTIPSYIGTEQLRTYQIRGDTLSIGGSRTQWPCRALIRVRE